MTYRSVISPLVIGLVTGLELTILAILHTPAVSLQSVILYCMLPYWGSGPKVTGALLSFVPDKYRLGLFTAVAGISATTTTEDIFIVSPLVKKGKRCVISITNCCDDPIVGFRN